MLVSAIQFLFLYMQILYLKPYIFKYCLTECMAVLYLIYVMLLHLKWHHPKSAKLLSRILKSCQNAVPNCNTD